MSNLVYSHFVDASGNEGESTRCTAGASIEEVAIHIRHVLDHVQLKGLCPTLRHAVIFAEGVEQKTFVAAAASLGLNPKTAAIQFRQAVREAAEFEAWMNDEPGAECPNDYKED